MIAPYFYGENTTSPWYKITKELLRRALELQSKTPVFGVVCVPKDVLTDVAERNQIIADYSKAKGILIWISEFRDNIRQSKSTIQGFVDLVYGLTKPRRPVYSLYGGFPSLLLTSKGLTGVTQGLCYGDSKSAEQIPSQGPPPSRFYIPFSRTKRPLVEARSMYAQKPRQPCDCPECLLLSHKKSKWDRVDVQAYFRRLASDDAKCKRHFAACRWREREALVTKGLGAVLSEWDAQWKANQDLEPESFEIRPAIEEWRESLSA